ncbi:MAG: tetratricopeptide repeat protein [Paludibacteraceae bacterium]|nr:tetratricopeptide repeat protein [Paludibacteraceae bacterium]
MKKRIYILFVLGMALAVQSCSTQKNTWASRSFHQTKTKYNIYYNGAISFREGEEAIRQANEDDFSTILNLYPVSNHAAAEASKSQMDRTIEKCRKCIKLHSIKARPKVDYDKKRRDPEYAAWLEQEEFNNQMGNAWILLAMAEFHKGDFLGSISTFNYIIRHYSNDVDMVARCQLWVARAYAEMGWLYEAEDMLSKVQVDHLSRKHAPLYAAVSADVLLKTKHYKDAIPFVKIALPNEKKRENKPRFQYVLAQLYQMDGEREAARNAYQKVIKMQPSNEMDFNARLRLAQLEKSPQDGIKLLNKMAKLDKNKDQLDQIYGTIGDVYLAQKDTVKALEYYEKAIESSVQHGMAKAKVLVTAGDIYYQQRNYIKASPCYKEATQILSAESEQYARIQRRSETLDELVVEYSMVQLQDSLQHLATLSEEEQRVVVDSIIARLIRAEEEEKERAAQAAREAENDMGPRSVNTANMLGGGAGSANWYFYNPQLLRSGKQTFRTQWGNRALEDNWRRLSKATTASIFDDDMGMEDEDMLLTDSTSIDSLNTTETTPLETDMHKPEYYLQQIPKTEEDIVQSNELLARALYNMVYIYRDKVGDQQLSDEAFEDFCKRFPNHELLVDLYYMQYLTALKNNDMLQAEQYRQQIIATFPESNEAYIVSQPDYFQRLQRMAQEQDSLYEHTYQAYTQNNFAAVKTNKLYAEENYPLSPLMPRFLFLNAIAVAKTDGQPAFIVQLQEMVARYPESELAAMAKDMLALMGQGAESQQGEVASLKERRAQQSTDSVAADSVAVQFSTERNLPAMVLLVMENDEQKANQLLYEVALFNFSQFMIKDFDLKLLPTFEANTSALQIAGFEKMDEAEWYINLLQKNATILQFLQANNVQVVAITEENFKLLNTHFSLQDYLSSL